MRKSWRNARHWTRGWRKEGSRGWKGRRTTSRRTSRKKKAAQDSQSKSPPDRVPFQSGEGCNYVTRSRLRHLDDTERTRHIDDIDGIPIVPLSTHNTDI